MKVTFKPYQINEMDLLTKDENLFFHDSEKLVDIWKEYIKKNRHANFLKVFVDDEFAGILCWGIMDQYGLDKNKKHYHSSDIDTLIPNNFITNVSWLYAIALLKEYRGKGLSHQLMQKYESESKKEGAKWLGLHVFAANNARFLYLSSGFKKIMDNGTNIHMVKKI